MKQQAPSHAANRTESAEPNIPFLGAGAPATEELASPPPTLPAVTVPDQRFRIDERTRRIGLAGVARARAVLAEQAARREARDAARAERLAPPTRAQQQAA